MQMALVVIGEWSSKAVLSTLGVVLLVLLGLSGGLWWLLWGREREMLSHYIGLLLRSEPLWISVLVQLRKWLCDLRRFGMSLGVTLDIVP